MAQKQKHQNRRQTSGTPTKRTLNAYQKRKRKKEQNQRDLIEGKFGQRKNAYGLNNIQATRNDTSESWISAIFFIMNLITLVKIADKYAIFFAFFKKHISIAYLIIFDKIIYQIRNNYKISNAKNANDNTYRMIAWS